MTDTPPSPALTILDGIPQYPWLDARRPEGGLYVTDAGTVLPNADPNLTVDYTPPAIMSGGWVNPPPFVVPVATP